MLFSNKYSMPQNLMLRPAPEPLGRSGTTAETAKEARNSMPPTTKHRVRG